MAEYGILRPHGIDISIIIAAVASVIDVASLYLPWLVGLNTDYVTGSGLTYRIVVELSGLDLLLVSPYFLLLAVAPVLTIALIVFSLRKPGVVPPRLSYGTKSILILLVAAVCSFLPTFMFWGQFPIGSYLNPRPGVFVSRWEFGSANNLPSYAGLLFALALGFRLFKE